MGSQDGFCMALAHSLIFSIYVYAKYQVLWEEGRWEITNHTWGSSYADGRPLCEEWPWRACWKHLAWYWDSGEETHLGGDFLSSGGHFPGSEAYLLKTPQVREATVTPKGNFLSPMSLRSLKRECIKLRNHTLYPVTDCCLRSPWLWCVSSHRSSYTGRGLHDLLGPLRSHAVCWAVPVAGKQSQTSWPHFICCSVGFVLEDLPSESQIHQ